MSAGSAAPSRRMDEARRACLAERADTPPEMLFFLANDPAMGIRAAIAANAATPPLADQMLAKDAEPGVRRVLARKLASLAPLLGPDQGDRHRRIAWETLLQLAGDEIVAVRAAITELVAEQPDVPRELILQLAWDVAMAVAEPVLRGSPLLDEEDLLALIANPPGIETLGAIARRPNLPEAPSDAIATRSEETSVGLLLANATARIRESTLLALAARSAGQAAWQAALARRPGLSAEAAGRLAPFLDGEALRAFMSRPDIAMGGAEPAGSGPMRRPVDEAGFIQAVRESDPGDAARILASLSGMPAGIVSRVLRQHDPKLLVALCWKAGLSARAATFAQLRLTASRPEDLLILPGGEWALEPEAMQALVSGLLAP